jgi:hypothetical protein
VQWRSQRPPMARKPPVVTAALDQKRPDSNKHMFLLDIFSVGWEDIEFLSHLAFAGQFGLQKTA